MTAQSIETMEQTDDSMSVQTVDMLDVSHATALEDLADNMNDQTLDVNDNMNPPTLFPAEVWLKIFQEVEPEDLVNISRVGHLFADLAREPRLWRKIRINAPQLTINNVNRICSYRWLEHLQLAGRDDSGVCIPEQFFINLATFSLRLKTLKIQDCVLEQSYINHLAKGCPGLKVLEISFCKLVGVNLQLSWFKELKVFNMLDCDFIKRYI